MQKNERITNIFARIARGEAEAILYHWVSNTFDTHIITYIYSVYKKMYRFILLQLNQLILIINILYKYSRLFVYFLTIIDFSLVILYNKIIDIIYVFVIYF